MYVCMYVCMYVGMCVEIEGGCVGGGEVMHLSAR